MFAMTSGGGLRRFLAMVVLCVLAAGAAQAQMTGFKQAVAGASANDPALSAFYKSRDFKGLWTGSGRDVQRRRNALMEAFSTAGDHGLPAAKYDPAALVARLNSAQSATEKGLMEVELSRLYLDYARSIQTGILTPAKVVSEIKREVPLRARASLIDAFSKSDPSGFLRSLPPSSPEYGRLLREKIRLERSLANGGWGAKIPGGKLSPGASGSRVVALRNRLIAMGFMTPSATQTYDAAIQAAVQKAQSAFGLEADGIAGSGTIEALNVGPETRLRSIIVAMERERWINRPRGSRHVWVNLTDFTATIMDNDRPTFTTRSVVGATSSDRQTVEFSDVMEFMVINPSWYVPRSIITKEYLPMLKANRNAVSHIDITDRNGNVISRGNINFASYNAKNFPYAMRQPPSKGNALGLVKFLFPNKYNIYLHDTPAKSLFGRSVRAYSHGCVRLHQPFEFAYALLAKQTANPQEFFHSKLNTGREARVNLQEPVPVHLVYRTAFTHTTGQLNFRPDIYGRDAKIWSALAARGVQIRAAGG